MKRTWEQEKAYKAKRAEQLGQIMKNAINDLDKEAFQKAYSTSFNYMTAKQRGVYYKEFLRKYAEKRKEVVA